MIQIDGSFGEGGGQILRTSLSLSLVTGKPFRISRIRTGRRNPGLQRQHITAVEAAAEVGGAECEGVGPDSQEIVFVPGQVRPGDYRFSMDTAGSACLVFQTILPVLMTASGSSRVTLGGGTHNPFAPPFDFVEKVYLPLIRRMGPQVEVRLKEYGFYPAGGGEFEAHITPLSRLSPVEVKERGALVRRSARVILADLPTDLAIRELDIVRERLGWSEDWLSIEEIEKTPGPGNVLMLEMESRLVTELYTGFGMRGVRAEEVASKVVESARRYLAAGVPVGEFLCDQLLVPLALSGGGAFRTLPPTRHTTTNIEVIRKFLDVRIELSRLHDQVWEVSVNSFRF